MRAWWLVVIACIGLLAAGLACGRLGRSPTQEGDVVRSRDGSATLDIPKGALPDGVKLGDIRVTPLERTALPPLAIALEAIAAYRLEPDGLRFKQPARLTAEVDVPDGTSLGIYLESGGRFERIGLRGAERSAATGKVTLSADIPHFSVVAVSYNGFRATLDGVGGQHRVGESFALAATFDQPSRTKRYGDLIMMVEERMEPTAARGSFHADGDAISPTWIPDLVSLADLLSGRTVRFTVTCVRPGTVTVRFEAAVNYEWSFTAGSGGSLMLFKSTTEPLAETDSLTVKGQLECVAVSTATRTPTPSSAANRPPVVLQIQSALVAPITTYGVVAADPDDPLASPESLTYEWRMSGEACGTPRVPWTQYRRIITWSHSDQPPDNCRHLGTDHDVTVSVTVSDGDGGSVTCVFVGSERRVIDKPECH